ncbi:ubox domain containing protein [Stylonychia lemnae]|uniref:Ubox domain containing protein n=1 Tax=Stylonychia lemnae TaxID=5949 RepID=A0A078B001_STYLE|nr:ubox domain containing protein [Stylonychia lemnae]|eukprot:CDW86368.1 ubox domain containing protein [Stylonychia lemnae]
MYSFDETPSGENQCHWSNFEVWSFFCPISNQLIEEPVISKYGHIYEKKSIMEWIKRKSACPITYKSLKNEDLIPIYSLKQDIQEYKQRLQSQKTTQGQK